MRAGLLEDDFGGFKIHPDGQQVALINAIVTGEVWVAENLLSPLK